ncbi:MAG: NAD-dependent protein deacetylase [Pseudomonadales bacterium]|nr:NAD-dependent protein deacetylase [Pseudomonadales bacterium]MCP5216243.1 NAD-dependent protein deacetylase [Pseudomonadales bacterium]
MNKKIFSQQEKTDLKGLIRAILEHPKLFIISGAGISTDSGIPDYRDRDAAWKRNPPVMHQAFIESESVRKRYWARSLLGWRFFQKAKPNASHMALYELEVAGYVQQLVTQNVDGLHQQAGSTRVIDLHGRIDTVCCLGCGNDTPRTELQIRLEQENPSYTALAAAIAPDGDADLNESDFKDFMIPCCDLCGGVYMPKVVFYGGSVPKERIDLAYSHLHQSDALLVLGSSLMVYSAYQFCRYATQKQMPVLAINQGKTRHDGNFDIKLDGDCSSALVQMVSALASSK